jgi:hypothetical protein
MCAIFSHVSKVKSLLKIKKSFKKFLQLSSGLLNHLLFEDHCFSFEIFPIEIKFTSHQLHHFCPFLFFVVLEFEPRSLCMLGKHAA